MARTASNALLAGLAALRVRWPSCSRPGSSHAHAQVAAASGCDVTIRPPSAPSAAAAGCCCRARPAARDLERRWRQRPGEAAEKQALGDGSRGRDGLGRPVLGLRQAQRPTQCQAGPPARDHQRRHRDDHREDDQERPQRLHRKLRFGRHLRAAAARAGEPELPDLASRLEDRADAAGRVHPARLRHGFEPRSASLLGQARLRHRLPTSADHLRRRSAETAAGTGQGDGPSAA